MPLFSSKKPRITCHRCGERVKKLKYKGQTLRSNYCGRCFCKKIEDGTTCQFPRCASRIPWCREHVACQATAPESGRCNRPVRDYDPEKYRFCSEVHNCAQIDCADLRLPDLPYCAAHHCSQPSCKEPREGGPFNYCVKHTCQHQYCVTFAEGTGDDGAQDRFCDAHRPCAHEGCRRRCHMRDNDETAKFCGEHYCHWLACNEERVDGSDGHCAKHTCKEQGCGKGIRVHDGLYCDEHECSRLECRFQRYLGDFCHSHTCQRRECKEEARPDGFCENHRRCEITGCKEDILVEGDKRHDRCDNHHHETCQIGGLRPCPNRAVADTHFCEDHLCGFRQCSNAKLFGCSYCDAHKCSVPSCQELRQNAVAAGANIYHVRLAAGAARSLMSGFCAQHSCRRQYCDGQALRGHFFCALHKCSAHGCANDAVNPAPGVGPGGGGGGATCDRHYYARGRRRENNNFQIPFPGPFPTTPFPAPFPFGGDGAFRAGPFGMMPDDRALGWDIPFR